MQSLTKELQQQYWVGLRKHLIDTHSFLKPMGNPLQVSWHAFALTDGTVKLEAVITSRGIMRVELYLRGIDAENKFNLLRHRYEAESIKVFPAIIWKPLPGHILKKVVLSARAALEDRSKWPQQFVWHKDTLEQMYAYFEPRISTL